MYQYIWAADAGDLVTSSFLGLLPHPPGFPIYWLILRIAYLLPFGSIALRASLVSLLFGVATAYISLKSVYEVLRYTKKTSFIFTFVGFLSVVLSYSSFVFLLYSSVQEVYTLSAFFLVLLTYLLLKLSLYGKKRDHLLFWLLFCIAVVHHAILFLLFGVYIYLFFKHKKKYVLFLKSHIIHLIIFISISFLPYILQYLLIQESSHTYWEPKSPQGFLNTFLRLRYGTLNTGGGFDSYSQKFYNIWVYIQHIYANYSAFIVIGLGGIVWLFNKFKKIFFVVVFGYLLYGIFLPFYANAGAIGINSYGIWERYYIYSYVFLPVIMTASFLAFDDYYTKLTIIASKVIRRVLYWGIVSIVFVFFPLAIFFKNVNTVRTVLSEPIFEMHARHMLDSLPKKSVLILTGDIDIFPVQYVHFVKGYRKDAIVLSKSNIYSKKYLELVSRDYPQLQYTPEGKDALNMFDSFVTQSIKAGYEVYTNVPIPSKNYSFIRKGYTFKFYKSSESIVKVDKTPVSSLKKDTYFPDVLYHNFSPPAYFYTQLRSLYAKPMLEIADYYYFLKKYAEANNAAEIAYKFDPRNADIVFLHTLTLNETGKCKQSIPILLDYFEYARSSKAAYALSRVYATCTRDAIRFNYWDQVYKKLK